jgi:ribA/ribD-fused uncharacterized protein
MIREFQGEYRFLSNFWHCDVMLDGYNYPSVEHAYQASKTRSYDERMMIRGQQTPGQAKRAGKNVTIRREWDEIKMLVMRNLVRQKFQDPELQRLLLATDDQNIVEGNRWGDTFWGMCNGEGENHLGRILMEIRAELRKEVADDTA